MPKSKSKPVTVRHLESRSSRTYAVSGPDRLDPPRNRAAFTPVRPETVTVAYLDGALERVLVSGRSINSRGQLTDTRTSIPVWTSELPSAPEWLRELVKHARHGMR